MTFEGDGLTTRIPIPVRFPAGQGLYLDEMAATYRFAGAPSRAPSGSGVLVLDPNTGEPLAQLSARGSSLYDVGVLGWLDAETLLLLDNPSEALVAWTYTTGERRLVSTASEAVSAVFATDLLD